MASWLDQLLPAIMQARLSGQTIPIPGTGFAIHPSGNLIPVHPGGSLISNLPVGQNSGLFSPTNQPVGSSVTMPTIDVTASRLPPSATTPQAPTQPYYYAGEGTYVPAPAPNPGAYDWDVYRHAQVPQSQGTGRPALASQAAAYRGGGMTTDQLNAASLAAAQQGRTFLQQGPYPASGNIVGNALTMPPGGGGPPVMLAPTQASPYSMPPQNGYTLNPNQGLY